METTKGAAATAESNRIDAAFHRVCGKLKNFDKQLNENFLKLTTNFDRFRFIWCIGFMHDEVDALLVSTANATKFAPKDATKAYELRQRGNELFKEKCFDAALALYNLAIRCAPLPSSSSIKETTRSEQQQQQQQQAASELCLAYANRSAVFFHLDRFDLCIRDVDKALKHGYPSRSKLIERKLNCLFRLESYDELLQLLRAESHSDASIVQAFQSKLDEVRRKEACDTGSDGAAPPLATAVTSTSGRPSSGAGAGDCSFRDYGSIGFTLAASERNTRIESASSSVTIDCAFDRGFFVKAVRDIAVGEIVVDEQPYAAVLLAECAGVHCDECLVPLDARRMSVAACRQCALVAYCGAECAQRAWRLHHRLECRHRALLASSGLTHMEWLAMRVVMRAGLEQLRASRVHLIAHEARHENYKRDESSLRDMHDASSDGAAYKSDSYLAVFNLVTNSALRKTSDLFRRGFVALFLVKFLVRAGFFASSTGSSSSNTGDEAAKELKEDACFVGGLVLRHLQSISCNAHEISQLKLGDNARKAMATSCASAIGGGLYALLSLFNHSCDPDVTRYFRGARCQLRAIKAIAKGQEVLDNYGILYATHGVEERQEKLIDQYFFQCGCTACELNWPLYDKLLSDLHAVNLKCAQCRRRHNNNNNNNNNNSNNEPTSSNGVECVKCQTELDNLGLEQVQAQQSLRTMLMFNALTDLDVEFTCEKIGTIYAAFCKYLQSLDVHGVQRPFQDFNNYQEALKQLLNFINMK